MFLKHVFEACFRSMFRSLLPEREECDFPATGASN
jgi:hypothetical protein